MHIPARINAYLRSTGGDFKVRATKPAGSFAEAVTLAGIAPRKVVQASVVVSGKAVLMIVHPFDREPDLEQLADYFKRSFRSAAEAELSAICAECDTRALPPLPELFGMKAVVDTSLEHVEEVYFAPGCLDVFVRVSGAGFRRLISGCWTRPVTRPRVEPAIDKGPPALEDRIKGLKALPDMPALARQILDVRNNPYSHISELAAVVEQDRALAAQIIRYASSSFFAYQGKIDSVTVATTRVLGMDFVMDLAFGLSLGRVFRHHSGGPLGLQEFWTHATHAGALAQALCLRIPYLRRPAPGVAYLSGLLHNFGFLLMGSAFPEQFMAINAALAEHRDAHVCELEREALGFTHTELGRELMEAWNMPAEVVVAAREHHDPDYRGDFAIYANLVFVANALLKRRGIGESVTTRIPEDVLRAVGLDEIQAEAALADIIESRESLQFIANKMAA